MTEAAPVVTPNTLAACRIGSVGKSLSNVQVRLGSDGEVLVRGPNVMSGYYRRPEAMAAALVENGGGRWLRTDDVGALSPDGYLHLRGRKKDVIVTSAGLKVYPEDVETVLNRQQSVRDSCVLERNGKVYAVLLLDSRAAPPAAAIVANANSHLNPAQRFQGYSVWPEADFPRTPTQKIQKYVVRATLNGGIAGPSQTPTSLVARILAGLAPAHVVQPGSRLGDDPGLSSIDRLELVTRLEDASNRDLPADVVTAETTVAHVEQILRASQVHEPFRPWTWSLSPPVRALRDVAQRFVIFPILRRILLVRVVGMENLRDVAGPVTITFGKPVWFPPKPHRQIAREVQQAVATLEPPSSERQPR